MGGNVLLTPNFEIGEYLMIQWYPPKRRFRNDGPLCFEIYLPYMNGLAESTRSRSPGLRPIVMC